LNANYYYMLVIDLEKVICYHTYGITEGNANILCTSHETKHPNEQVIAIIKVERNEMRL